MHPSRSLLSLTIALAAVAPIASAQTFYNTSLQNVNGVFGTSTATTTTTPSGTRTVVTGPGPNAAANRAQGTPVLDSWYQANVGAGSTVGITTDYPRSGNGSAYFSSTQGDPGKADLVYNFGSAAGLAPIALASLTSFSFDVFRDAMSTTNANFVPVLRFSMFKDGVFAGALIYENVYNTNAAAPVNAWTTLSGNLTSGLWWTNNASLGPTFASAGGTKTLAQWIADNQGSTLSVYGLEIGIGSGWNDTFYGAVDNVDVHFASRNLDTNFEVAATAAPEPATLALMGTGLLALGGVARRRRRA